MKKFAAIVLITLFLAPVNQTFAAVKAGDTCKKAGQTSTISGVTYSCVKKGKKFVWTVKTTKKSEVPTANPTPTPAATATPVPTPTPTIDPAKYLATEPLPLPQSKDIQEGKPCSKASWPVVGYLFNGSVGYVVCAGAPGYTKWETNRQWLKVDAATRKPLIPVENQELTLDTRQPFAYIVPTLSTKSPTTTISPREQFANVEPCRLKEDSGARSNSNMGFPIKSNRIPLDDRVVVQVIPVDFADVRATTNPADDLADALSAIEVFWERQASKKVDIVIQVPDKYFNLKKNVLDYGLNIPYSQFGNGGGKNYWPFADEAAAAVDDLVDFSKVDIAIVTGPPAITDQQIGTFVAQKSVIGDTSVLHTKEKVIENFLIRGADEIRDIFNWIHEFGHMFGLTDFGHDSWADPSQNATNAGKGFFDIMTSYRSPELYVWHRFLLGVLNDSQIDCVTSTTKSTHLIRPVASSENVQKGVVIPLSSTEAIVIESRRRMGYDATLGKEGEGALVYKVDTSASFGEQTGKSSSYVLSTAKSVQRDFRFSMPLKNGESVSYGGWKITVVEAGEFGDVVSVEKG
jgi:M6 family metalloprotease-like protein